MKNISVNDIAEQLGLEVICCRSQLQKRVTGGYVSDLLSDVMGNAAEGEIWITLQSHLNVVAIASLKEISAVVLVKGIRPDEQVIAKAEKEGIPILTAPGPAFEIVGKIYHILND